MNEFIGSEKVELKEKYTDVICKDLVAFLNTDGGDLVIGVKDNGVIVGVESVDETLRKIFKIITNQIEPNPQDNIKIEIRFIEGKTLICIHVSRGNKNLYCQMKYGFSPNGCFIRIGTTYHSMTIEQIRTRYESNFTDCEYTLKKRSALPTLTFNALKIYCSAERSHIEDDSFELNLNLKNIQGEYNLLAELLADRNNIPFIFFKFDGYDKDSISKRYDFGYRCLIIAYEQIKIRLQAENICITDTTVRPRIDTFLYDFDCVNEAIFNAIVYNDWTITEPQISMFKNRIEILSYGGLPKGLTNEQFFSGISKPRNATLMRIFLSLDLIDHTDHGIPIIIKRYGKEAFEITDSYIKCTIPFDKTVMQHIKNKGLQKEENVGINQTADVTNDGIKEENDGINQTEDGIKEENVGINQTDVGIKEENDGINQADDGIKEENDGINQTDVGIKEENDGINQADDGIKDKNVGINQTNDGIKEENDGINQTDDGIKEENVGINQSVDGIKEKNVGINQSVDGINDGIKEENDGINHNDDGLNKTEKAVLRLILNAPNQTIEIMTNQIGVSQRTIERALAALQKKGKIKRMGSRKTGTWKILK